MTSRWSGWVLFSVCALPLAWLSASVIAGRLGPDPVQVVMLETGQWALILLLLTLGMSPLRRWSGWSGFLLHRRQLGLWAFVYATLHLLLFAQAYVAWSATMLYEEFLERTYISAGLVAWLLLLPLALTSTRAAQRRLRRRWGQLHRLIYPAVLLACLHVWWQVRSDVGEALLYSAIAFALLAARLRWRIIGQKAARSAQKTGRI